MLQKTSVQVKKADIVFALCFIGVLIYALYMAPYGFSSSDESFYLTVPYRLSQGDVFFVDEWHVSQLTGFLLYPLMKLFLAFSGSTDGIVLSFRYYYVVVTMAAGLYIYFRSRRISSTAAIFAALIFTLYDPFCIRALSYNSMGVMFMSLCCITAATVRRHGFADMIFSGICLAAAVLCCPYLAVLFAVYIVFVPALNLVKKRRGESAAFCEYAFSMPALWGVCIGVFALFLVFCVFVLSRSGLKELISSVPYIFLDPEHSNLGMLWYIKNYIYCVVTARRYSMPVLALCVINTAAMFLDRHRMSHRKIYALIALVLSVVYNTLFISDSGTNFVMLSINYLGFTAYCLSKNRQKPLFSLVFVPGLIYSVCLHHASTQRYMAICNAAAVCALASAFFIVQFSLELNQQQKADGGRGVLSKVAPFLIASFLLLQIGMETYYHSVKFYQDSSIPYFDTVIDRGVQKGLKTTRDKADHYNAVWDDTQEIRAAEDGFVLYVSYDTWLPLGDSKRSACYSGWTYFDKAIPSTELIMTYLELHPEKSPSYIYVPTEFVYSYQLPVDGMQLLDILNPDGRPVIKSETGYIIK